MRRDALAQCVECHYTETLDITLSGLLVLTGHFRMSAGKVLRHRCGGPVRLWTGQEAAFTVRGVIA